MSIGRGFKTSNYVPEIKGRKTDLKRRVFGSLFPSILGLCFSIVCCLFFCGCITSEYNVATHKQDTFIYSTDKEVVIGENLHRQIAGKLKLYQDPSSIKKIKALGAKIAGVCGRKEISYYFYIIDRDENNAFCTPGGYVYIYKGLLDLLTADDEIAFVLAHEVGHLVARHSIKRLQAALGYNLLILASLPMEKSPQFYEGLSIALAQIVSAYSREDEFKADEMAVKYTKLAGFSPEAGIDVLEKLYQEHKKDSARPLSYFRTHPYIAQRIKHIKQTLGMPLSISDYMND